MPGEEGSNFKVIDVVSKRILQGPSNLDMGDGYKDIL